MIKPTKTKKCKVCGHPFRPFNSLQIVDTPKCAVIWAAKQKTKSKHARYPDVYSKENKKNLQDTINLIARLIDNGETCIDCDKRISKQWDGGHRLSRGAHPALRYNLHNIFQQDTHCNTYRQVDEVEYLDGVEKIYGKEYRDKISTLAQLYPRIGLSHNDTPEALAEARKIVRELKKLGQVYPASTRIRLRDEYNIRIGIYTDKL